MLRAPAAAAARGAHATLILRHEALPQHAPDAPVRPPHQAAARSSWM